MSAAGTVGAERDGGKSQREHMYREFQTWAVQTYGDSGKTKTVTRKKYRRITRYLSGDEKPTTDNAKFRFWVKSKGFVLSPLGNNNDSPTKKGILYVPVKNQGWRAAILHAVPCAPLTQVECPPFRIGQLSPALQHPTNTPEYAVRGVYRVVECKVMKPSATV
ncbi:Nucleolar protein 4 [Branchiostoma belcheri]|nr:Nucleolar protein 4 [Branchiostoma belcheri]